MTYEEPGLWSSGHIGGGGLTTYVLYFTYLHGSYLGNDLGATWAMEWGEV